MCNVLDQHFLFDDFFFRLFTSFVQVESLHSVQRYPARIIMAKKKNIHNTITLSIVLKKTLPKALWPALTSDFGLVGLVQIALLVRFGLVC